MFDELILNETLVDYQVDWITEQTCEECGYGLEIHKGRIVCPNCDTGYEVETTILKVKEVN